MTDATDSPSPGRVDAATHPSAASEVLAGRVVEPLTDGVVRLVKIEARHIPALTAAVQASLPELSPFMPWALPGYDDASSREFITGDHAAHSFALIDPTAPLRPDDDPGAFPIGGVIGINDVSDLDRLANLGYWIRSDLAGQGLATTAAKLVAEYAFEQLGVHRLEVFMSTENPASQAIAENLGARYDGLLRGRLLLHGRHHDAHLYSLLATDDLAWRSVPAQL